MYSKTFVSAVAALGMATGAVAIGCDDDTITISSSADATVLGACKGTVKGNVEVLAGAGSQIEFSGQLTGIGGDFTVQNNGDLVSLSSSSLRSIGGNFYMHNVTQMSSLGFTALTSVGKSIDWATLSSLGQLNFGTGSGITSAQNIIIADTFLKSLDGLNVHSLQSMNINNNRFLTDFTTELVNLTQVLNINANGIKMNVNMPNLVWAANMTISNVTSFSVPSLAAINGSIRFDSNYLTTFNAPNLTAVQTGDVSFISNSEIQNISMPLLKSVGGGFTIANNTAMQELNGFPKLESIGGAVLLLGTFTDVELPALDDVKGGFSASSTGDIDSSCDKFKSLASGAIQGKYLCTSNNSKANDNTSGTSGGSSGNGSSAANIVAGQSMSWIISLVSIAGFVIAFL